MNIINEIETSITISNIDIIVVKKNIKYMHLNVLPPDGKVRVAVPHSVSNDAIRLFVIKKLPWIRKYICAFQNQPRQTKRNYVSGETHYFKGIKYKLNLIDYSGKSKVELRNGAYIDLYVKPESTATYKEQQIYKWYRDELKKEIPLIVQKWENSIGVKANEVRIKKMKTRWGTCKIEDKRIWLNLELIKTSQNCLEYIIVHELLHLLERKHNDNFRFYLDKFMPKWKMYKRELADFALLED